MTPEKLRDQLANLRSELAGARQVDPQARRLLGDILVDIHRLIDAPETPAELATPPLADRLEGVAVRFEADHPALAASVRRFVDLLGKVGL